MALAVGDVSTRLRFISPTSKEVGHPARVGMELTIMTNEDPKLALQNLSARIVAIRDSL